MTDSQPLPNQSIPLSTISVSNPTCPLSTLATLDKLIVKQKFELLEAFTGFETNNKYTILNPSSGQHLFFAAEDNDCCTRNFCGPIRPFEMSIVDPVNPQQEVIHVSRPFRCDSCCFPCCLQEMEISAPPGNVIGRLKQNWSVCCPNFSVMNEGGETVMKIKGPCWTCSCGRDVIFKVVTLDGKEIGNISKKWSGFAKEMFTDADNFGVSFPMDLDVKMKAVLLGACFLIVSLCLNQLM